MKTVRNITLVSLLAAGVMSVPAAHAHYKQLQNDINRWAEGSAIKATITFTEPNQHGMDFAAATTGGGTQFTQFVGVKEQLDWALGLEHRLASGWTRIFFDYDHYHADDSSSFTGTQRSLLTGAGVTGTSTGEYNLHSDSAKLGMRHRVNHSRKSIIDLGAALSWVDADRDFTATQNVAGVVTTLSQHADFDAFGPFFDVTVKHYTNSRNRTGFNVQMYAGAGLLYSETKFNSSIGVVENFDREKVKGVSAEMIAKLGLGWDYRFCNRTMLSTTLGYMFMNYSDAFSYGATGGAYARFTTPGIGGLGNLAGAGNSSGGFPFTRQGPYLEFKWSGAGF